MLYTEKVMRVQRSLPKRVHMASRYRCCHACDCTRIRVICVNRINVSRKKMKASRKFKEISVNDLQAP